MNISRTTFSFHGTLSSGLFAVILGLFSTGAAHGDSIFVTNYTANSIGEYTTSGTTVNASLVTGLQDPGAIGVSGSDLFVTYIGTTGMIGEYATSGATVNPSLVTGLGGSSAIAVSGSDLFVANGGGAIGEYTTSGATVNPHVVSGVVSDGIAVSGSDLFVTDQPLGTISEFTTEGIGLNLSLVSGLNNPRGIVVSGSDLFVANGGGTIGEYTTSGATVNASLVTGLSGLYGIALLDSDLFVTNVVAGTIGEYTTSGATVNASLVTGLSDPVSVAVVASSAAPEPSTVALFGLGLAALEFFRRSRAQSTGPRSPLLTLIPAIALTAAVVGVAPVYASPITVPVGLAAGSQYRLVFVTDDTYTATSTAIGTYNAEVNAEADGVAALEALGTTWMDIGSTSSINAIDNVGADPGVPIYSLAGLLVAGDARANAGGLFPTTRNANFANPIVDKNGNTFTTFVWTGTGASGALACGIICYPLGNPGGDVALGNTNTSAESWDYETDGYYTGLYPLYGISGILTVPSSGAPEPSTTVTASLGGAILCLFAMGRKRRSLSRVANAPR